MRPASKAPLALTELTAFEQEVFHFLLPISEDYPGIERWFLRKVIPGYRDGTRSFFKSLNHNERYVFNVLQVCG